MTILGIDAGNHQVKVVGPTGTDRFSSMLGDWREIKLKNAPGPDDMEVEFQGKKWFAGTLAENESFLAGSRKGVTKANDEVLLRVLLALFRYDEEQTHDIIVGQPIKSHTDEEKEKIIDMLTGKHEITVNGKPRTIRIRDVGVAAEGASVGLLEPIRGTMRILDVGSGTINWATVGYNGKTVRFYDKDSGTEEHGMATVGTVDIEKLAWSLGSTLTKRWSDMDNVRVVGAVADELIQPLKAHFPNAEVYRPLVAAENGSRIDVQTMDPVYANAVAFFTIARAKYGKKR